MLHATKKGLFIVVTSLALLLAACGSPAPVTESAPAAPEATTAPTEAGASAPAESTAPTETSAPAEAAAGEISFSKDILPVFESRCVNCHGGQRTSEGLDLKTYDSLVAGSENGSVLTPGDAANSLIVELATSGKMPKRGPKLTPAEVQLLTDWVNAGAPNN